MIRKEEIDRCLVVIFDIAEYSKKNPERQARLVTEFIEILDRGSEVDPIG